MASYGRRTDHGAVGGEGTDPNPTDRRKTRTKRRALTVRSRHPPGGHGSGRQSARHEHVENTVQAIMIECPQLTEETPHHVCRDKGDDDPNVREVIAV